MHLHHLHITQERYPSHTDVDSSTPLRSMSHAHPVGHVSTTRGLLNPIRGGQSLEKSPQPQQLNDMEWEEVTQHQPPGVLIIQVRSPRKVWHHSPQASSTLTQLRATLTQLRAWLGEWLPMLLSHQQDLHLFKPVFFVDAWTCVKEWSSFYYLELEF